MNEKLTKQIMGRVYAAYVLRRIFNSSTLRFAVGVAAFSEITALVSWGNIVGNMMNVGVNGMYTFTTYAIMHTGRLVQVCLLVLMAVTFMQITHLVKMRQLHYVSHRIAA